MIFLYKYPNKSTKFDRLTETFVPIARTISVNFFIQYFEFKNHTKSGKQPE